MSEWRRLGVGVVLSIYTHQKDKGRASKSNSLKDKVLELQRQAIKVRPLKNVTKIFLPTHAPWLLWPRFAIPEHYFFIESASSLIHKQRNLARVWDSLGPMYIFPFKFALIHPGLFSILPSARPSVADSLDDDLDTELRDQQPPVFGRGRIQVRHLWLKK